jgi:hypothetical protein
MRVRFQRSAIVAESFANVCVLLDIAGGGEHFFGARANADIFGEILPAHDAGAVDQELCRTGDVVALGSPGDMQQVVAADYL